MISMMPGGMIANSAESYSDAPWSSTLHKAKIAVASDDTLAQLAISGDAAAAAELKARGRNVPQQRVPLPRGGVPMADQQPSAPPSLQDIATGGWTPPWQQMGGPSLPPGTSGPSYSGGQASRAERGFGTPPRSYDRGAGPEMPDEQTDVTAPISQGAAQAEADTGAADQPAPDDIHPALVETAKGLQAAEDDPSQLQSMIQQLLGGGQSDSSIRSNAIAKAGFAMAASRNPYFFGAVGEGGQAGLEDYEKAKQEQLMNRVRAVGLGQQQEQQGETKRSNVAREGQEGQRIEVLKQQAQLAQDEFVEKKRQFEAGFATDQELKRAQIAAQRASAAYSQAAAGSVGRRGGQYLQDADGNLLYGEGADVTPIMVDGKPVKANKLGGGGTTALAKNSANLVAWGLAPDEASAAAILLQGKTMSGDNRRRYAMQLAQQRAALDMGFIALDPVAQKTYLDTATSEIESALSQAGGPVAGAAAAPIGANAAPVAAPAAGGGQSQYQEGAILKQNGHTFKVINGVPTLQQ